MISASHILDRVLVLEMVRVTEAAAIAASKWIGRGDNDAADAAAVEAMRTRSTICHSTAPWSSARASATRRRCCSSAKRSARRRGRAQDRHRARSARRHDHHRHRRAERAGGAGHRRGRLPAQRARRLYGQDGDRPGLSRRHHRSHPLACRKCPRAGQGQGLRAERHQRLRPRPRRVTPASSPSCARLAAPSS